MTAVFLQARLCSQRLPNKVMLPLAGKPLIVHAMEALRLISADVFAVLTDPASRDVLMPLCHSAGFDVIAGHPSDVLLRYASAVEYYSADIVIRATGDNPLVSSEIAQASLELYQATNADYAGILHPPYGTAVEVVSAKALLAAHQHAESAYEREHVTAYIYKNPNLFNIQLKDAPAKWRSEARLTVDTQDDYEYMVNLFSELYQGTPITIDDMLQWCKTHPQSRLKVS